MPLDIVYDIKKKLIVKIKSKPAHKEGGLKSGGGVRKDR